MPSSWVGDTTLPPVSHLVQPSDLPAQDEALAAELVAGLPDRPTVYASMGTAFGDDPGLWELVLDGPAGAAAGEGDPSAAWEYARRDSSLNVRTTGPMLASAEWPEPARPDLDYYRRLWFSRRAEEFIYFGPGPYRARDAWPGAPRGWVR